VNFAPSAAPLGAQALDIDAEQVVESITESLRRIVQHTLRRRGAVIGVSGGIDSSVTAALCARAFGSGRTLALLMPEADSDADTLHLSCLVADAFDIEAVVEDITPILQASRCYERRQEAVRTLVPEFGDGWKFKIALPSVLATDGYRLFSLVVQSPDGETIKVRLPAAQYLTILAATNFKQRTRKMLEYFHADRLNYAVVGTPNRLEYDQGFFVKLGDGAADVKPIAHLYKTQVYRLAEYLGVPERIRLRPPTTDTYSLAQTQDEFYFSLPHEAMDLCLYAHDHGIPAGRVAEVVGLSAWDVSRVFDDIEHKRRMTRYLHLPPQLVSPIPSLRLSETGTDGDG
jgi:NAD+ synthase